MRLFLGALRVRRLPLRVTSISRQRRSRTGGDQRNPSVQQTHVVTTPLRRNLPAHLRETCVELEVVRRRVQARGSNSGMAGPASGQHVEGVVVLSGREMTPTISAPLDSPHELRLPSQHPSRTRPAHELLPRIKQLGADPPCCDQRLAVVLHGRGRPRRSSTSSELTRKYSTSRRIALRTICQSSQILWLSACRSCCPGACRRARRTSDRRAPAQAASSSSAWASRSGDSHPAERTSVHRVGEVVQM